jgi:hypothetical protein
VDVDLGACSSRFRSAAAGEADVVVGVAVEVAGEAVEGEAGSVGSVALAAAVGSEAVVPVAISDQRMMTWRT